MVQIIGDYTNFMQMLPPKEWCTLETAHLHVLQLHMCALEPTLWPMYTHSLVVVFTVVVTMLCHQRHKIAEVPEAQYLATNTSGSVNSTFVNPLKILHICFHSSILCCSSIWGSVFFKWYLIHFN